MDNSKKCSINDIPNELLSRIFQEYVKIHDVEKNPRDLPPSITISYKARAFLCAINHRMREVAIQLPQLWTYVQVPGYPQTYPPIPLLKLWTRRFGSNLPIYADLYPGDLTCGHPGDIIDPQHESDVIELLRPHLHRWRFFKIFFTYPSAEAFVKLPLETADKLEKFEAVCPCDQELNDKLLANIAKLPALRYLDWDRYYNSEDDESSFRIAVTNLPWRQLRSIRLSVMMSPDETLQVLSASTSAVVIYLKLRRDPSSPVDTVQRPLVTLPELRCLEIHSDVGIYETLQHLDLPGLKGFRLSAQRFQSNGPNIFCARYKDFISRISTSLDYLLLDTFDFTGGDVYDFFTNPKLLTPPVAQFRIPDDATLGEVEKGLQSGVQTRSDVKRNLIIQRSKWGPPLDPHYIGWLKEGDERSEMAIGMDLRLPCSYHDFATWAGR